MSEKLKRFAAAMEPEFDAMLQRVIALRRTALTVVLVLGATHAGAWILGRLGWPL